MKLAARFVEKPWGRTDIESSFGAPPNKRIGEIWFEHPAGDAAPLMVKILFTSERLSVQVHPDDGTAKSLGYPQGKEECWLVLSAEPDATLGVGLLQLHDPLTLRQSAIDGSIEDLIDWRPAKVGDFVYNSAGTIHAIGAGLTVVEIQQNVDCTFRLYDYGRPRELHLDEGLSVANRAPHHEPRDCNVHAARSQLLVDGPKFNLVHMVGGDPIHLPQELELTVTPLSSGCQVANEDISFGECAITVNPDAIHLATGARALVSWASAQ